MFTYADGGVVKLQELYLPEEWGTIDELYEADYPFAYSNGVKIPYQHEFRDTFHISWAEEQCSPIDMIELNENVELFLE